MTIPTSRAEEAVLALAADGSRFEPLRRGRARGTFGARDAKLDLGATSTVLIVSTEGPAAAA